MESGEVTSHPSILIVGPSAVGKHTLINSLTSARRISPIFSSSGITCHSWTIDTKYYTADVEVLAARTSSTRLGEQGSIYSSLFANCQAAVMVFDLADDLSFGEVERWASGVELASFEILILVGNKADQVAAPQRLKKRTRFVEWCSERGAEYVEASVLDPDFDKKLSEDGDMQGVARVRSALSAHMWPGMVLKPRGAGADSPASQNALQHISREMLSSDGESECSIEYELLSDGPQDIGHSLDPRLLSINSENGATLSPAQAAGESDHTAATSAKPENSVPGDGANPEWPVVFDADGGAPSTVPRNKVGESATSGSALTPPSHPEAPMNERIAAAQEERDSDIARSLAAQFGPTPSQDAPGARTSLDARKKGDDVIIGAASISTRDMGEEAMEEKAVDEHMRLELGTAEAEGLGHDRSTARRGELEVERGGVSKVERDSKVGGRKGEGDGRTQLSDEGKGTGLQGSVDALSLLQGDGLGGSRDEEEFDGVKMDDLEKLMMEMSGMRDTIRSAPDHARREMAAAMAMKMAALFGLEDDSDEEM